MANKTRPKTAEAPSVSDSAPNSERLGADVRTDGSIRRERIFEILSNERRRLVLRYLRQSPDDGDIEFRALVDQVAAWENDTTREQLDSGERKCVYTALRQTHLPKLDESDVVDFDRQRGEIELNDTAEEVFLYMRYSPERELRWSRVYLALAALCAVPAVLIAAGVAPLGGVSEAAVIVGIAAAFGTSSLVQMYRSSRNEV